jgi:hypothetical protein
VNATSTKWVKDGKAKEFRIEKKKVGGKIQYYFDKDGDGQIDNDEKITEKQKKKYDKNNNLKLDADVTIEGEGTFVQGAGIAFKDSNKNGKLDLAEYGSVVNSKFGDLTISDDAISSIEYWDINNNNQLNEATDFRVRTNDDEIRYLDLNRNGNLDETEPQSESEEEPFLISEDYIKTSGSDRYLDLNGNNIFETATEFKILTNSGNATFLDLNRNNTFDAEEPHYCEPGEPLAVNISSGVDFLDFNGNGIILKDDGTIDNKDRKVITKNLLLSPTMILVRKIRTMSYRFDITLLTLNS